ncbi:MAG: hypothetical protein JW941_13435 [Candidatus Coatesbacteria bacterium]|nr:hypothetical protein [Candidatus Coatesbacteria bacterium]
MESITGDNLLSAHYIFPALLMPLLGALIGRIIFRKSRMRGALIGFAVGLFGPFAVILLLLYTWLSESLGLSNLINIMACLGFAVALGAIWGLTARACLSKRGDHED